MPGMGGSPDPMDFLSQDQQGLEAEYHAMHREEVGHQVEELDRSAKFRKALAMMTQTFATIAGRPDIAAQSHKMQLMEDEDRARKTSQQMLAHVGLRAIEKENTEKAFRKEMAGLVGQRQQGSADRQSMLQAVKMANAEFKYRRPSADGAPPDQEALILAYQQALGGDLGALEAYGAQWPRDDAAAAADAAAQRLDAVESGPGAAKKQARQINVAGAGAQAAAAGRAAGTPPKPKEDPKPGQFKTFMSGLDDVSEELKEKLLFEKGAEMTRNRSAYADEDLRAIHDAYLTQKAKNVEAAKRKAARDAAAKAKP